MVALSTTSIIVLLTVGYLGINSIVKGTEKFVKEHIIKKDEENKK